MYSFYVIFSVTLMVMIFQTHDLLAGIREHFLSHGPSVTAHGRGETCAAYYDDNSCLFYNPSLLAGSVNDGIVVTDHPLFDGTSYRYTGINLMSGKKNGSIALSVINLKSGDIELRRYIDDQPDIIHTNQWAYYISYSRVLNRLSALRMGIAAKYIYYDMYKYSGSGIGLDIGISKPFNGPVIYGSKSELLLGASALNISPPKISLLNLETINAEYRFGLSISLPVIYRSASYDILRVFTDAVSRDNAIQPLLGMEYAFFNKHTIRIGLSNDHPTAGLSLQINTIRVNYSIDFTSLDNIHGMSLSYIWGSNKVRGLNSKRLRAEESLMSEAKIALNQNKQRNKEVDPMFKSAYADYKNKRYLMAADKFKDICIKYPQLENSALFYSKINDEMSEMSGVSYDSDLEKVSYAQGYVYFRNKKYYESINAWEKVLQINPKRYELTEYISKVKMFLKDDARLKYERETEERAAKLFSEGETYYNERKWIACIKMMEELQRLCKNEPFRSSYEFSNSAQRMINNAITELSKIAVQKRPIDKSMSGGQNTSADVDKAGAERKYTEGLILYAQGKYIEAVGLWEIAIRLDPTFDKAYKAIQKSKESNRTINFR